MLLSNQALSNLSLMSPPLALPENINTIGQHTQKRPQTTGRHIVRHQKSNSNANHFALVFDHS